MCKRMYDLIILLMFFAICKNNESASWILILKRIKPLISNVLSSDILINLIAEKLMRWDFVRT